MKNCTCKHERLLHDNWGCKICKGGCGISIIYLSELFATETDKTKVQSAIDQGKALDARQDQYEESQIRSMHERTILERTLHA